MTQRTWRDNRQARKKRAYADLDPDKHAAFKEHCIEYGVGMSDLLERLIDNELGEKHPAAAEMGS